VGKYTAENIKKLGLIQKCLVQSEVIAMQIIRSAIRRREEGESPLT